MPFKSMAQEHFMFAKHPKIAQEFAAHTPDMKGLPAKLQNSTEKPESPWLHLTINVHNHHPEAMSGEKKGG
jgi:hypothetical protein